MTSGTLFVAYPRGTREHPHQTDETSVFVMGQAPPGSKLLIAGHPAKLSPHGFFSMVVPLKDGLNQIRVETETTEKIVPVQCRPPLSVLPAGSFKIHNQTIQPDETLCLKPGDSFTLAFSASLGAEASFTCPPILNTPIPIPAQFPNAKTIKDGIIDNREITFREKHQTSVRIPKAGYYITTIELPETIALEHCNHPWPMIITLSHGTQQQSFECPGNLEVWSQDRTAVVQQDRAVFRTSPHTGERLSPLRRGTTLKLTGALVSSPEQTEYRVALTSELNGWVKAQDVHLEAIAKENPPINILTEPDKLTITTYQNNQATVKAQSFDRLCGYEYNNGLVTPKALPSKLSDIRILIDPGHGGAEMGALGLSNLSEKNLNLTVSKQLESALKAAGFQTSMTRTTDVAVSLPGREQKAIAQHADIVLSIHHNALPDGRDPLKYEGPCCFYYHGFAKPLAEQIQHAIVSQANVRDFGTFYESFYITRIHQAISILIEVGFFTNPHEYEKLIDPQQQQKVVKAITSAVVSYCSK